jgi:hypothetical protein
LPSGVDLDLVEAESRIQWLMRWAQARWASVR